MSVSMMLRPYNYRLPGRLLTSVSSSACHQCKQLRREVSTSRGWKPSKPSGSEVLTCHLVQNNCPPWTSYFVRYDSIVDDQWGRSHFNWEVGAEGKKHNYHILRTGCYPYIKYHCSQRAYQDLSFEDRFFRFIKVFNLGLPCLAYGIAAIFMIKHKEQVKTSKGPVTIYFLYAENRGSSY